MAKGKTSALAVGLLAVCILGQAVMQRAFIFDRWKKDYAPKKSLTDTSGIDPQQFLFALAGFREMIAGILWVRADAFFDSGNYDAILPIIRLVTILDPKQIDVYATGMWHIGYNFTDEEQRSDRRYIPSALALGKEGARQNPETYEMFFETGWMWYHKIDDDYQNAVKWFEDARTKPDMLTARKNLLSMAYQRNGQVQEAVDNYAKLYQDAAALYAKDSAFGNFQNKETLENNLDTMLVRMVQRGWKEEQRLGIQPLALTNDAAYAPLKDYDVYPPFDVGFSVKATVLEPRVIRFEGTWNVLPVGTRVRVVLRDQNYYVNLNGKQEDEARPAELNWDYSNDVNLDPPRDKTFMQDQLFVRSRRFNRRVDMSKDPTMYPFTSDKYWLEFYYNPRSAPPHIQDKFSWNGEGMTDKNYLNTEVRPGQRVVYARMPITRDQILRLGEWQDRTPVIKTPNYKERVQSSSGTGTGEDVVVDIPSLRSGK